MAHHEPELSDEGAESSVSSTGKAALERTGLIQQEAARLGLGPTGRYPEGKLTKNDEGEIKIGIVAYKGKVVINFGKPIVSLGMNVQQTRALISMLRRRIKEIQRASR